MTGGLLFELIAFVPVLELAKLANAFKILIFGVTNVALIAFREGEVESYDPAFESLGHPCVQVVGGIGGIVLLTQMGGIPILGAVGIIGGGIVWYRLYGRERTEREGWEPWSAPDSVISFSRTGRRNCWTHVPATCCWCGLSSLVKTRRSAASSSDMYSDSTLHVRSFNVREHVRPVS